MNTLDWTKDWTINIKGKVTAGGTGGCSWSKVRLVD